MIVLIGSKVRLWRIRSPERMCTVIAYQRVAQVQKGYDTNNYGRSSH